MLKLTIVRGKGRNGYSGIDVYVGEVPVIRETRKSEGWWKGRKIPLRLISYRPKSTTKDPLLELDAKEFKKLFGFLPNTDSASVYEMEEFPLTCVKRLTPVKDEEVICARKMT